MLHPTVYRSVQIYLFSNLANTLKFFQLFCGEFSQISGQENSTSSGSNVNSRISVFWTGFEAEDATARLFKLIGLLCVIALTTS